MKLNQKLFYIPENEPFEVQEVNGHKIEKFYLNDYKNVMDQFVLKGKFAVWSSVDGINYRLFIEEGYQHTLKPLFSDKINDIWLTFWDKCEYLTNRYIRRITYPLALLSILAVFILPQFLSEELQLPIMFSIIGVFFGFLMFIRVYSNKKVKFYNHEAIDQIKAHLGDKKFDQLLNTQRSYIDEYFENYYKQQAISDEVENNEDVEIVDEVSPEEVEVVEETIDNNKE